jgi:cell division protein FtsB
MDEPVVVAEHSVDLERPAKPEVISVVASEPAAAPSRWSRVVAKVASVNSRRAVVAFVVVTVLALILAVPMRTYFSQRGEFNRLQAENVALGQEIDQLQRKVTQQNDPAYIEQQARERLQYKKPGEKLVVLRYPERDRQAADDKAAREHAANPWYENLWDAVSTPPEGK